MAEQEPVLEEQETVMAEPEKISCNLAFCDADMKIVPTFKDELNKRGLECQDRIEDGDPGKTLCGNRADGIILCDKTLFLVSANFVSACKEMLTKSEHDMAVVKARHKYVKIDGECDKAKDYPMQLESCTFGKIYVPGVGKEFWDDLAKFVKKDGVSWGDPAHGNAWSYYDGYLRIVFNVELGFKRRVEDCKKANDLPADARVCEKLLVLCPPKDTAPLILKECANIKALPKVIKIPPPRQEAKGEPMECDPNVATGEPMDFDRNVATGEPKDGAHNVAGNYRSYDVTMYSVTGKNANEENVTIYVPMTVNLTLVHMYKMYDDKDKFFDVDEDQMQTQGIIFIHILKQILQQMKRSEQVQILTLEDNTNKDNLADLILRNVKFPEEGEER